MALILTAALLAGPALPTLHGLETKDELKIEAIHQIRAHRSWVHEVRARRRQRVIPAPVTAQEPWSPVPSPTYTGGWADELAAAGFPDWAIPTMLAIIDRESGGDPNAINPSSGACGLTQLYPCPGPGALDPMTNLRYAYAKFQASGFAPWGMG